MNELIWTKEELKKIKAIILNKANLTINDKYELVEKNNSSNFYLYNGHHLYQNFHNELEMLFYYKDRNVIENILSKTEAIIVDSNNPLHYGLIRTLSKINPKNHYEIFSIYKEILALYEHTIHKYAEEYLKEYNPEEIKQIKNDLKNSIQKTEQELLIEDEINKILESTNGIFESELFLPLINKLNLSIKDRLINKYNSILGRKLETKRKQDISAHSEHLKNFHNSYINKNLSKIKEKKIQIYKI